ncbi:dnaE2 [Acanthosepion pharaonis]|uniref:DnaE2 n=1 Tax=Acanthosepion pharaonis TaxID=158019 RepID=A0A812DJX0_ACAPH|nr:dnaE2 [Sepia pharaonis]
MVHPYLRRREGTEKAEYPRPSCEAFWKRRWAFPFQEQAMRVAIVGAGFTPAEADQLRRAMATFKFTGGVSHFCGDKLVEGMVKRGYPRDFAERTFKQIEGFGSMVSPKAMRRALRRSPMPPSWMKCHHPDIFALRPECAADGVLCAGPDCPRRSRAWRGDPPLCERQSLGLHLEQGRGRFRRCALDCEWHAACPTFMAR